MNLNQSLSWKFLLPVGIIISAIFYGGVLQIIGTIMVVMGIIDLFRQIFRKKQKEIIQKPK